MTPKQKQQGNYVQLAHEHTFIGKISERVILRTEWSSGKKCSFHSPNSKPTTMEQTREFLTLSLHMDHYLAQSKSSTLVLQKFRFLQSRQRKRDN